MRTRITDVTDDQTELVLINADIGNLLQIMIVMEMGEDDSVPEVFEDQVAAADVDSLGGTSQTHDPDPRIEFPGVDPTREEVDHHVETIKIRDKL